MSEIGIDDVPAAGSDNLVKSGGVYPLTRKYVMLEYWGSSLTDITALNNGSYFFNSYTKKIALKNSDAGSFSYIEFQLEKNQLYFYKNSFFVSNDGVNMACISTAFNISIINASSVSVAEYEGLYQALITLPLMMRNDVQIISFINSSTHKYEYYIRLSKEWSTNINNWMSLVVDETINKDSNNAIANSAVAVELENLDERIGKTLFDGVYEGDTVEGITTNLKFLDINVNISDTDSSAFSIVKYNLSLINTKNIRITASTNFSNPYFAFYSSSECTSETLILLSEDVHSGSVASTEVFDKAIPLNAKYLVINKYVNQDGKVNDLNYIIKNMIKSTLTGKKWVCVGDSLTAINDKTTKHYFDFVQEETGIIPINWGVSGSGYARRSEQNDAFYQRVQNIPLDADVVTIFGSFNDLGSGLDIGTVNDNNTTTLAGCINTTINNIQNRIPLVRLGIIAPTPWQASQPSTTGRAYDYVEILKSICERRSIPFLDLWRCSNLRPWDADFRALVYNNDPEGAATHPNEIGHSLIAPMFREFIKKLI